VKQGRTRRHHLVRQNSGARFFIVAGDFASGKTSDRHPIIPYAYDAAIEYMVPPVMDAQFAVAKSPEGPRPEKPEAANNIK